MMAPYRLRFVLPVCSLMLTAAVAAAENEPKPAAISAETNRKVDKVPRTIVGSYRNGALVELRVRDRIAFLIKPTGQLDSEKRWLWDFPFWLAINDGFGTVAHRHYVEQALAAGFHVAG